MPPTPVQVAAEKVTEAKKVTKIKKSGKPRRNKKKTKTALKRMNPKQQQQECRWWIETITGTNFKVDDFHEALKDGVLLCRLVNKINPKKKARFKKNAGKPFVARENIAAYIDACKRVGVSEPLSNY